MTQRPSLFTPISYYAIILFSFVLIFANGWFTAVHVMAFMVLLLIG